MPVSDMSNDIGLKLFEILDEKAINDRSLERALNLTPKTVSNWRRGTSHSYMKMLYELAEYLEIQLYELIQDETVSRRELTRDEQELLVIYRRAEHISVQKKKALRETFSKMIDLYTKANSKQ